MEIRVDLKFTPAQMVILNNAILAIKGVVVPLLVNLPDAERKSKRKMGEKGTGYVVEVYDGLVAHDEIIPNTFKMSDFADDRSTHDDLSSFLNELTGICEKFDDSKLIVGHQLMHFADGGLKLLEAEVSKNASIKTLVESIKSGHKKPRIDYPIIGVPLSGSVSLDCKPGQRFTNMGTTVFILFNGLITTGGITVGPGDSTLIPEGWYSLRIVNQSGTTAGAYRLI